MQTPAAPKPLTGMNESVCGAGGEGGTGLSPEAAAALAPVTLRQREPSDLGGEAKV